MGTLIEIKGNLFNAPGIYGLPMPNVPIVHCISADYALGAGIAKEIERRYNVRPVLKTYGTGTYPDCLVVNNIINMVTKQRYWNKPTYNSFEEALRLVADYCIRTGIRQLVMPRIGSGLDKLNWDDCKQLIEKQIVSKDINVEVYYL